MKSFAFRDIGEKNNQALVRKRNKPKTTLFSGWSTENILKGPAHDDDDDVSPCLRLHFLYLHCPIIQRLRSSTLRTSSSCRQLSQHPASLHQSRRFALFSSIVFSTSNVLSNIAIQFSRSCIACIIPFYTWWYLYVGIYHNVQLHVYKALREWRVGDPFKLYAIIRYFVLSNAKCVIQDAYAMRSKICMGYYRIYKDRYIQ